MKKRQADGEEIQDRMTGRRRLSETGQGEKEDETGKGEQTNSTEQGTEQEEKPKGHLSGELLMPKDRIERVRFVWKEKRQRARRDKRKTGITNGTRIRHQICDPADGENQSGVTQNKRRWADLTDVTGEEMERLEAEEKESRNLEEGNEGEQETTGEKTQEETAECKARGKAARDSETPRKHETARRQTRDEMKMCQADGEEIQDRMTGRWRLPETGKRRWKTRPERESRQIRPSKAQSRKKSRKDI